MEEKENFKQEAIELLIDLLKMPSVNGIDNERNIARFIFDYFKRQQVPVAMQEIDDQHANVIATLEGKEKNNCILWNGHVDTVPYGNIEEWSSNPQIPTIVDGKIIARGAADMKSGLAAMIFSLCYMKKTGYVPEQTILLLCTCDEEKNGIGASKYKEELAGGKVISALIIGEPTNGNLGLAQKGCIWLSITVYGKTSHGAYPKQGVNAVEIAYQIASKLKDYIQLFTHEILGEATAQITKICGGIAPNMTPDQCDMLLDIRIVPGITKEMLSSKLEEIFSEFRVQFSNQCSFEYEIQNDREAIETAPDQEYVCRIRNICSKMQNEAHNIGINYFTDASILAKGEKDLPVIVFGPGEPAVAHQLDEYVDIDKYLQSIQVFLQAF